MSVLFQIVLPFLVAFCVVLWVFPKLLNLALSKNLVDNPDARKLQKRPIPVLGGMAVFFGISVAMMVAMIYDYHPNLFGIFLAMGIMLYIGTMDDLMGLSPNLRFLVEIVVVLMLIYVNRCQMDDFHGLFGVGLIPMWASVPLTVFAAVGIINAINLIDGVNGLSSGYCVMACIVFGAFFYQSGDVPMVILAAVSAGALIPFFLHNVFGLSSKMFIGDGGTLVMGVVMATFVAYALFHGSLAASAFPASVGLIPFTLAALSVPVFDTLRVMVSRILRGVSPFHPDKTHLHHIFIALGCSHSVTTVSILTINFAIVLCWLAMAKLGWSVNCQLYVVIALGFLATTGLYHFLDAQIKKQTKMYNLLNRLGEYMHFERRGIFLWLQKTMDKL